MSGQIKKALKEDPEKVARDLFSGSYPTLSRESLMIPSKTQERSLPKEVLGMLEKGGVYVCGILDDSGQFLEHTIIIAFSDDKRASHADILEWAESIGSDLPTCIETAVMFAKLRDRFKRDAYWTKDICDWNTDYACYHYFNGGSQGYLHKDDELYGVAVRRVKGKV